MRQNATNQPSKEDLEFHTVPGMVRLLCGDVIQLDGGPCIVVRSNFSGATCQPLQKRHVERETLGVGVVVQARHFCMCSRGVGKQQSSMVTSQMRGALLRKAEARAEFMALVGMKGNGL